MSKKETKEVKEEVKVSDTTPVKTEGEFKIKSAKKMKSLGEKDEMKPIKVDLSKKEETKTESKDAIQIGETKKVDVGEPTQSSEKVDKEVRVESDKNDVEEQTIDSPIQEIKNEDSDVDESRVAGSNETTTASQEQKEIPQEVEAQKLPENIEKLIQFMEETGGTVDDYARLSRDYSNISTDALLHEYYKAAKPHLDSEERSFIIEDSFSFDEELDEARDVRKKKLAYKEEVAKAKNYLESLKGKYYEEIKLRPGVTQEQQKAMDFFNRHNEEQEVYNKRREDFKSKSKELLNNDFKGFDFNVGDKKFRYSVKDPSSVADNQSDISNFIGKFLNKEGEIVKHKEYHKALYTAQNADAMAQHFYEQGKTDAIKDQLAKSKNISTESRKTNTGEVFIQGLKVKAVSGLDSSSLRIKKKTFN
jgi:hypothetical protein